MNYANQVQTEIVSIKKNMKGDYVNVSAIVSEKGACQVDIRMYYTDDAGEKKPTTKGVRFSDELAADIAAAIIRCTDDVEDTLDTVTAFVHKMAENDESDEDADENCEEG